MRGSWGLCCCGLRCRAPPAVRSSVDATVGTTCHSPAAVNKRGLCRDLTNTGRFGRGNPGDSQGATSTDSAKGTSAESSSVDATTELSASPAEDAVGSAVSVAAPVTLGGADQAAVEGAGAGCGLPVSVAGAGDVGAAVVSALATAVATAPAPAAVPSLLGSASVPVDVAAVVAHGSDVVVADADVVVAVAVSAPFVVLPDGATASVAAEVHDVFVVAAELSVATVVLSTVVVVSVVEDDVSVVEDDVPVVGDDVSVAGDDVSVAEDDVSVAEDDVSVAEDDVSVAEDDVSVAEDEVPVVEEDVSVVAAVSVGCAVVSPVCAGGVGTTSALAGAIQADAETTATIRTAVQPIRRRKRRRRDGPSKGASPRVSSVISSLPRTDPLTPRIEYRSYLA
jgi:hypothetical protein